MEIIIDAVLVKSLKKVEIFPIRVTEENFLIVKKKLESQKQKIVKIIKKLYSEGKIKSITYYLPRDKSLKKDLKKLKKASLTIRESISKIREAYRNI